MVEKTFITEQSFEIRHDASGTFIDVKGGVADFIKNKHLFPHWRIQENLVGFFDTGNGVSKEKSAVIAYNKVAFSIYNSPTANYFQEQSLHFWKIFYNNKLYSLPAITRFGVRTKCYLPSKLSFEEIYNRISKFFLNQDAIKGLGGRQKDLQITLDLEEKSYQVKIGFGPLKKDEARRHFSFFVEEFKQTGLYIDVDCFQSKELSADKVSSLFKNALEIISNKIDNIAAAIDI